MASTNLTDLIDNIDQIIHSPSFLGFSPLVDELRSVASRAERHLGYPPRNIIATTDNTWMLEVAAAGFASDDMEVEECDGYVMVTGHNSVVDEQEYLYQGLARRDFNFAIKLGENVVVDRDILPTMNNGVLKVHFIRLVPEAMKSTKWTPTES